VTGVAAPEARPRRRLRRVLGLLAVAGPGLIAANAGNDAGGILTYASAGAQFAYRTLFLMVLVTVALVVVQEMCARLGAYTGEGLGALIREQFSPRASAGALALLLVANAGLTVSEFAGIGAAVELFGVSRYVAIPVALVALWVLTVFGTYSKGEASPSCSPSPSSPTRSRRSWPTRTPTSSRATCSLHSSPTRRRSSS
jgi:Mn2+/Fe2+ NRAMP family transporter